MSDNKINNKLDFRNLKSTQFDPGQVSKMTFSELQSSTRTYRTNAILKDAYTHFIQDLDVNDKPLKVSYYQATDPSQDRINFRADSAGDLAGTYFTLQEFISKKTHVFYYVVSGSGIAPGIGDIETPINIITNDASSVVSYATRSVLDTVDEFVVINSNLLSSFIDIEYLQFGENQAINVGTTGFLSNNTKIGESFLVGEVELTYNIDGHPIYNGNVLKGLLYNPYTASFDVERDEISVTAVTNLDPIVSQDPTIYNVAMTTSGTEYSQILPLGTKRIKLNVRDHLGKYTVGWVTAGTVVTKSPGSTYEVENLDIVAGKETIYFTGTKSGIIMEIEIWK